MEKTLTFLALFFTICAAAAAQVEPAATGPGVPLGLRKLHYTLRYSQTAEFGTSLGDWQTSTASASADYANENDRLPFSMNYGGGYNWTISGPSYTSGLFQHLFLSQGIVWRKWNLTASDDVSYLPEAPTTGFSGIPGIGEPIGGTNPLLPPSTQLILTLNTHVVNNNVNVNLGHTLNYAAALSAGGSSTVLRYPDGNGLDTNTQMAHGELTWRLNARNSLTDTYMFSQFSYPAYNFSFVTNTGTFGFERVWNRKITTNISAGPQWTRSSDSTTVPPSLGITVNATANYQYRFDSASLAYSRGVYGGAGYLIGGESDIGRATFSRQFGRTLGIGIDGSYQRTAGLVNNGVTDARYGGVQATKQLGSHFSAFASYTAISQSSSSTLPANTLGQLMHVIAFGIGYSPRQDRSGTKY